MNGLFDRTETGPRAVWRVRIGLTLGAVVLAFAIWVSPRCVAAEPVPFRLTFSGATVGDIPHNDVLAALRVWTGTLVEGFALPVDLDVSINPVPDLLAAAYRKGELDGVNLSAEEYLDLGVRPDSVFVIQRNGSIGVRYLLLTRKESMLSLAEAVTNRTLLYHRTSATCLVPAWLEGLRTGGREDGAHAPNSESITQGGSKAILRVFFRQADVCVATESAFMVARELNPQVGSSLKILATSPEMIPSAFFLSNGVRADLRESINRQIGGMDRSSRGRQILTVFQGECLRRIPAADWEPTLNFLREWRRSARLAKVAPGADGTPDLKAEGPAGIGGGSP